MARNGIKTGGRKKGTPNKKTNDLIELLGDYNPLEKLIELANNKDIPLETKIKINLDLLPYIYPKRKAIDFKSEEDLKSTIYINSIPVKVEKHE